MHIILFLRSVHYNHNNNNNCFTKLFLECTDLSKSILNYANNKNVFIHKESKGRFGFKVASEILRHDQHTAIPEGRICEIRLFSLRTISKVILAGDL